MSVRSSSKGGLESSHNADLLAGYNLIRVLRTLHVPNVKKNFKVRFGVKRIADDKDMMLVLTSLVDAPTLRETINELIKCAELNNEHRLLTYSSAFMYRHMLFVEYPVAYDLEQILREKSIEIKSSESEKRSPVLNEEVIGHILRKVLKALAFLHKFALHNNVVTRSIILTNESEIKLSGFKYTIAKSDNILKIISLRNDRFFGRPTQWAPEETLLDYDHYGTATEIWHVGLLIPEMVTGYPYHLVKSADEKKLKRYAQNLVENGSPMPCSNWLPDSGIELGPNLRHLWNLLMHPNAELRPTIEELLDKRHFKFIQTISKSKIKKNLLLNVKKSQLSMEKEVDSLEKWDQLSRYSKHFGAADITLLEPLCLGAGPNEFFLSFSQDRIECSDPMFKIDFRRVPVDLLICVCFELSRNNNQRVAADAVTLHLDLSTALISMIVCRNLYKFVHSQIIGFISYIRICLEIVEVLRLRNVIRAQYKSWKIYLEANNSDFADDVAHITVIFDGHMAKQTLEGAENGIYKEYKANMPDSLCLASYMSSKTIRSRSDSVNKSV